MSLTFDCRGCEKPASYTSDDDLNHENLDALACRFDGLTPEEIQARIDAEITCTCGLTFPDQPGFDGHQDQIIQENGSLGGHWEVGTI